MAPAVAGLSCSSLLSDLKAADPGRLPGERSCTGWGLMPGGSPAMQSAASAAAAAAAAAASAAASAASSSAWLAASSAFSAAVLGPAGPPLGVLNWLVVPLAAWVRAEGGAEVPGVDSCSCWAARVVAAQHEVQFNVSNRARNQHVHQSL